MNLYDPLEFDPHALKRMRERRITANQVLRALRGYHTSFPAEERAGVPVVGVVYIGEVDGRDLIVWVEPDSDPVYVRSVAWREER